MRSLGEIMVYPLRISIAGNIFQNINVRLLDDFDKFKRNHKTTHCIFKQDQPVGNKIRVTWVITQRYPTKFVEINKVERQLVLLNKDNDQASMDKITYNDNFCTVSFKIIRDYNIKFIP